MGLQSRGTVTAPVGDWHGWRAFLYGLTYRRRRLTLNYATALTHSYMYLPTKPRSGMLYIHVQIAILLRGAMQDETREN